MIEENDKLENDTFFDIHLHTFDLSHPSFSAFLKRFQLFPGSLLQKAIITGTASLSMIVIVAGIIFVAFMLFTFLVLKWAFIVSVAVSVGTWVALIFILIFCLKPQMTKIMRKFLDTTTNLLSVFENDIGSFFLIIENCLREECDPVNKKNRREPHLKEDGLHIGNNKYKTVVLTPLMMDFGLKGKVLNPNCHYGEPSEKPIMGQVADVFTAINRYTQSVATLPGGDPVSLKYTFLKQGTQRLFEVYPFLGINTQNYSLDKIQKMLNRYFNDDYSGSRSDLKKILENLMVTSKIWEPTFLPVLRCIRH